MPSSAHWPPTLHSIISTTDRNVRGSYKLKFNPKFVSVAVGNSQTIAIRLSCSGDRTRNPRMRVLKVITESGRMSTLSTYLRRHYTVFSTQKFRPHEPRLIKIQTHSLSLYRTYRVQWKSVKQIPSNEVRNSTLIYQWRLLVFYIAYVG